MKVEIISYTQDPLDVISRAAGTSTGKDNVSLDRVESCWKNGHFSVFEHASVTFRVEGISRTCSHQLVRHRMASFVQESQRYTEVSGDDWYVIPPDIEDNEDMLFAFINRMVNCMDGYHYAIAKGFNKEDARFMLPEATKTALTVTMNVRELSHFFDLRLEPSAQWEIRNLAMAIYNECSLISDQWDELMMLGMTGVLPRYSDGE